MREKKSGLTIPASVMQELQHEFERRRLELQFLGIDSVTKMVLYAVREWLAMHPPRLSILNHHENTVRVKDTKLNRVAEVTFALPDKVSCSIDGADCIHIVYVLSQPDVVKTLREKGWRGHYPF